jgi:HSP20 family protein
MYSCGEFTYENKEDDKMTIKDLVQYTGSPLSRILATRGFNDVINEFDKLIDSWDLDMKTFTDLQPKCSFPKINIVETDTAYEVEIAIAGFGKEDISLELKDNCLLIKADKKEEVSEKDGNKKYLMREISSRSFRRAVNFPKDILKSDISCSHKDGVVKCVLKKETENNSESVEIKID